MPREGQFSAGVDLTERQCAVCNCGLNRTEHAMECLECLRNGENGFVLLCDSTCFKSHFEAHRRKSSAITPLRSEGAGVLERSERTPASASVMRPNSRGAFTPQSSDHIPHQHLRARPSPRVLHYPTQAMPPPNMQYVGPHPVLATGPGSWRR